MWTEAEKTLYPMNCVFYHFVECLFYRFSTTPIHNIRHKQLQIHDMKSSKVFISLIKMFKIQAINPNRQTKYEVLANCILLYA